MATEQKIELFVKRLSDDKLFPSSYCTFFLDFKQVLIEHCSFSEFILNEGEFEIVYKEINSFKKSYEENDEMREKHFQLWKKFEKEFCNQNPEPDLDWDSEEYKSWRNSFFTYIKEGLKANGFEDEYFSFLKLSNSGLRWND